MWKVFGDTLFYICCKILTTYRLHGALYFIGRIHGAIVAATIAPCIRPIRMHFRIPCNDSI